MGFGDNMARVTCCSLSQLSGISEVNDVSLFIVRNPKSAVKDVSLFQYLAPSKELYSFAMQNKSNPNWWELYKCAFEEELKTADKRVGLDIVQGFIEEGFNVNLVCYCGDYTKCHRSLVADKLRAKGIEVRLL